MSDETVLFDPLIFLGSLETVLEFGVESTVLSGFGRVILLKDPFLETIGTETLLGQVVSDHRKKEYVSCFPAPC